MTQSDDTEGDDLVPLSAINAYLYCDRRAALRHLDALHVHNEHTRQGDIGHRRADKMGVERRPGVRTERGLWIVSQRLRLYGRADLVEFHKRSKLTGDRRAKGAVPYPVEYKRGRSRRWNNDDVQLCAQALCLEEMLGEPVPAGAVYHALSRKRREVPFSDILRAETEAAIAGLHALLASHAVPPAVLKPRCRGCSLRGHCLPEAFAHPRRAEALARDLFSAHYSDPQP
ncbi:CRISPR-associated exonuclease, Cas4 family [Singulisphaera sp. GP187]|uniref:CRISPR-associated protein Cas4 n=1 Tax=Singulisphaera sp. GP187 TaxID=1882752 RepID=UPI000928438F|nr:CRISPR-associated protein Cas4 [Singulisphaera sp. GP187]SIO46593.1 CRISPR-associated exonuclease, Cas4 family [Singulisphaera sp. GP187]